MHFNGRLQKDTSNGSKMTPAERFKNDTSIEKTKQKDILKQQTAVDLELKTSQRLVAEGFDFQTATKLIEKKGVAVVERQLKWLDARKPDNRVAMLRKSIEDEWAEPAKFQAKKKIAEARMRDTAKAIAKQAEDNSIAERKQKRHDRKQRLMAEWENAGVSQRGKWIDLAIARESSTTIRKILKKQKPQTSKPHVQVLDEIAIEVGLQQVTETIQTNDPRSVAEQPQQQNFASDSSFEIPNPNAPPKEKMPTELVSF
jgi:hypothetical protein